MNFNHLYIMLCLLVPALVLSGQERASRSDAVGDVVTCFGCFKEVDFCRLPEEDLRLSAQHSRLEATTDIVCTGSCAVGACACGTVACLSTPCNPHGLYVGAFCCGSALCFLANAVRSRTYCWYFTRQIEQLEEEEGMRRRATNVLMREIFSDYSPTRSSSSSHGNSSSTRATKAPSSSCSDEDHAVAIAIFAASHGI